jgi:hypothetical protein
MKRAHAPCSICRVQTFVYFLQRRKSYEFCARNTLIPRQINRVSGIDENHLDRTKMHYVVHLSSTAQFLTTLGAWSNCARQRID